ncbi:MAG: SMC-Scp complex subunit ScpB, partial [Scardovia wiggsiae]
MSDADMPAAEAAPGSLRPCMEAILMVADNPVSSEQMARALDISEARADEILRGLAQSYDDEGRGFELHMTSRGWQLANRPEFETAVSACVTDGPTARLSQAARDTLAIV